MKKLFTTLLLALTPIFFFGQTVFDKYDGKEGVNAVIVNKKMFQMMGNVKSNESQQYLDLIKKLDNLKVFRTTNTSIVADMKATAANYVKTAGLDELMRVNDKGQNVKIMVKAGATPTQVKELLMLIDGSGNGTETVLMSLIGTFELNEISLLTEKMKLPGGDELKKVGK
ncbi:MAG: DUF4252 domain-containing protein [Flavobacterium sp.]